MAEMVTIEIPDDVDPIQYLRGCIVEQEHTSDLDESCDIGGDHLREIDDYYDRLEIMETEAKMEELVVQSKLYSDQEYTLEEVEERNPDALEIIHKGNYYRARQMDPDECDPESFVTIAPSESTRLIMCNTEEEPEE